jgi:hypothetical protein
MPRGKNWLARLGNDFNCAHAPRRPMLLAVHPSTTLTGTPSAGTLAMALLQAGAE